MSGYVTIIPAHPRSGWAVAAREGCVITHTRLLVPEVWSRDAARAEAQRMYPDREVWMVGVDTGSPPWDREPKVPEKEGRSGSR